MAKEFDPPFDPGRPPGGGEFFSSPFVDGGARLENITTPKVDVVGWDIDGKHVPLLSQDVAGYLRATGMSPGHWERKVNIVSWPRGQMPGKVKLLLTRYDLYHLDLNGLHTLNIRHGETLISFVNLVVSKTPVNITPGPRLDYGSIYLVEFSDLRHLLLNKYFATPLRNAHYNVPAADTGTVGDYYEDSLDGDGNPWTWQTLLDDIWERLAPPEELGDSPELPFDPDGVPEGIRFVGTPAWSAYNEVLHRLGCAFVLTPSGAASVVRLGADDPRFDEAMRRYNVPASKHFMHDEEPFAIVRGQVPAQVVVQFNKVWEHYGTEQTTDWREQRQTSTNQVHYETVDCPEAIATKVQPNSKALIHDDLRAMTDPDGVVTNGTDLEARAEERAEDYYRMVYSGLPRMHVTFSGWIGETDSAASPGDPDPTPSILPGSQVAATYWYDHGFGPRTEIWDGPAEMRHDADGRPREWNEDDVAEFLKGPDFARPTFANYPHLIQIVQVVSSSPEADGTYDGRLTLIDPRTLAKVASHRIWILDPNQ